MAVRSLRRASTVTSRAPQQLQKSLIGTLTCDSYRLGPA